jgi:hypothetical protein
MSLKAGKSRKTLASNISEFHKGATFRKTEKKFGKKVADKQAVAVSYEKKRESK